MQVIDEETNIARLARKAGIPYLRLWRATTGTQLRPEELRSLHAAGWMLRHEGRAVPEPEPIVVDSSPAPAPVVEQTPADAAVVPQRRSGRDLLAEHMKSPRDPFPAQPTN